MDLMKLSKVLKEGAVKETTNRSVEVVTPIFRLRFAKLKKPGQLVQSGGKWQWEENPKKWDEEKAPYYQLNALFNAGNKDLSGFVDLRAVYLPALAELAKSAKVEIDGLLDEDGSIEKKIRKLGMGNITYLESTASERNRDEEGNYFPGTGPGIFTAPYKSHCTNAEGAEGGPLLIAGKNGPDGKKVHLLPVDFVDGYWCRAFVQFYANKYGTISQSFNILQLLAKDTPLGNSRRASEDDLDEVEDADDLAAEAERVDDIDDVDL